MKNFSKKRYLIGRSALEIKLVYTFFLIFMLFGFLTILGYEFKHIGFGVQFVAEHYVGSQGEGLKFEKSFVQILETAHFHAFIMGIVYLTIAHIFIATTPSFGFRLTALILGFVFTLMDLVLPFLIRYVSPSLSPILIGAWVGEWITYMIMILIPLYDMWILFPKLGTQVDPHSSES